jgi:hypothetical protein
MREYSFGRASSIAMNDPFSYSKKRNAAEGFDWLFEGEHIAIYDGVPAQSGMKYLHLTDDYPYPHVEIGSKEMLFNALQNGQCVLSAFADSMYDAFMMGPKKRAKLLREYFEKLPEGTYVLLSEDWD